MPFHVEQLKLNGLTDEQLTEAAEAAAAIVGISAYLHGIDYDLDTYMGELEGIVEHAKSQAGAGG